MNHEGHAGQAEVEIGGPATCHSMILHEEQTHSISQCQSLIGESTHKFRPPGLLAWTDWEDLQWRHRLEHGQELQSSRGIVALEKPAMPFGDHKGCGQQRRWVGEKPSEERVVCVGAIGEGNER